MSRQLITEYRSELDRIHSASGSKRESVVREAFKDLLKRWGKSRDLIFLAEHEYLTPHGEDKGLIITTGTFTADARKEATRDGAPAIDLIDGEALCLLLKDKALGVRVEPVITEKVVIEPSFFDEV